MTSNCCHLQSLSLECTRFKTKSQNSRKTTLNIWEDVGRYLLAKGNIYCQHADEQIWHLFSLLFLFWFIVGQCLPTQIIVQTDVVQAIFSHVLMVARAVRHVTSRKKDLTAPVIRQGKYCEIGRHDLFFLDFSNLFLRDDRSLQFL